MSINLSLTDFIKFEGIASPGQEIHFPTQAFDLFGDKLKNWINELLNQLGVEDKPLVHGTVHPYAFLEGRVFIAKGAKVEPTAYIQGPTYIGPGTEVRHGAYIRGSVYVGKDCVVGHTTELKSAVFFDGAKAGHFAYVGDSILGRQVNLGAGTKLANLRLNQGLVSYTDPKTGLKVESPLKKFGAILGDFVQTGCNSVLSPGALLLPRTSVLPCAHFKGTLRN